MRLEGKQILDNVSLEINHQDFITIIGPNGAGKSTLLKALIGLIKPDSGSVVRTRNLKIGYIPQKLAIEPSLPMTVKSFIQLNKGRVDMPLIEHLKIAPLLEKATQTLSGGEWQSVLLARALLGNPDLIILDEPAQNLDITSQMQFYRLLDSLHQSRKLAILLVSHDLHLVMASTKKVVCLYHHICCSGTPQTVARDPEFVNLFGQDMASMMAIYHHDHDHHHHEEQYDG